MFTPILSNFSVVFPYCLYVSALLTCFISFISLIYDFAAYVKAVLLKTLNIVSEVTVQIFFSAHFRLQIYWKKNNKKTK